MSKKILKKMLAVAAAMIILVGWSSPTSAMAAERVTGGAMGFVYGQESTMVSCRLTAEFEYTYGRQVSVVKTSYDVNMLNMSGYSAWPTGITTGGSETAEVYASTELSLWYGEVCIDECWIAVYCDVYGYVG